MAPLLLLKGIFNGPKILAFVAKYWKEIAVVSMIALLAYQNFSDKRFAFYVDTIPYWKNEAALNKDALDQAVKANELLTNTIKARNAEISKWKDVSDKLAEDNKKLKGTIDEMRVKTNQDVEQILGGATPQGCSEALQYLRDGVNDLKWPE